ncbi:hypothetical protein EST38_g10286 [Candolleomyces aberdarensis]|uniref:F-box domain-containing protein n=1 Tax=Candolleomyces aberdarensis TaxID=2316362 RepID=A0A4Q2D9F6_9AGAR|nr:hypothetical protein EST38_g10286 [Candolleomyces aberdarensis]
MVKGSSRKTRKLELKPPKIHPSDSKDDDTPDTFQSTLKYGAFIDLPLDILCEIFKLLPPLSLLQLARTAKSCRKFLMSRASKSFWTCALSDVEALPPCPDDMSEPHYVHLMFSNDCHDCLRPLSELMEDGDELHLYLEARTQLCRACSLKHFKRWGDLPEGVTLALSEFVLATTNRLTKDELKDSNKYSRHREPQRVLNQRTRFHVKTALALHSEYQKIKGTKAKKAWKDNQRKLWVTKEEHANACKVYFDKAEEIAKVRDGELRVQRIERVREKLMDLGWGEELKFTVGKLPSEVYDWCYSSPAKELTDKEWESVKDQIVSSMERTREARLKIDIRKLLKQRIVTWVKPAYVSFFFSQPPNTLIPTFHEVCLTEAFRTPLCTLPLDQKLSADLFESAIAQLPAFAEEWRNHRIEQVLTLVRNSPTYKATPANDITADAVLPLASTIFKCADCKERLVYPSVLTHQCLFAAISLPKIEDFVYAMPTPTTPREIHIPNVPSIMNDVSLLLFSLNYSMIWKGLGTVKFDDDAHQHALLMLDALDLSRTKTTVDEMEAKQPYVECLCQCFWEPAARKPTAMPTKISTRSGQAPNPTPGESQPALTPRERWAARWLRASLVQNALQNSKVKILFSPRWNKKESRVRLSRQPVSVSCACVPTASGPGISQATFYVTIKLIIRMGSMG